MCRRLAPCRLAAEAWKRRTPIWHLRAKASLPGGFDWLKEKMSASNGDAALVQEQGPVEKADPRAAISSTPDSERNKEPEETKFSWSWKLEDLRNENFFKNEASPSSFLLQLSRTLVFSVPLFNFFQTSTSKYGASTCQGPT
jgi:hypothetical protein